MRKRNTLKKVVISQNKRKKVQKAAAGLQQPFGRTNQKKECKEQSEIWLDWSMTKGKSKS